MGQSTDFRIRAWQENAGLEPATGEAREALREMSQMAFELIKVIELEKSGIRDGDGLWHGSDVLGGTVQDIVQLHNKYLGSASEEAPPAAAKMEECSF